MEVEGLDLVGLLEGPTPLPDDLDDFFPEEFMQYLTSADGADPLGLSATQEQQAPAPIPLAPVAAPPTATATAPSPSPSSSSGSRSECTASPVPALPPTCAATAPLLAALPAHSLQAVPRLVTTAAAQQMWTAMLQAAYCAAPSAAAAAAATTVCEARAQTGLQAGTSRQASRECSGDSSDTDQDDMEMVDSKNKSGAGSKRKAPEVDWRQIEDPAERRRQRRLAKNRVTAARSRERKKAMWSELEEKLKNMENENLQLRAMLEQFARENASLKSQLLTMTRAGMAQAGSAGAAASQARAGKTMDPAAILPVFIVTLLVVCSLLPGDKAAALLGSVLPLALVASLALGANGNVAFGAASAGALFESLFRLTHMLGTLVSGSSRALQRSLKRLLFERHRYLGRGGMKRLAGCCSSLDALMRVGVGGGCSGSGSTGPLPKLFDPVSATAAAAAGLSGSSCCAAATVTAAAGPLPTAVVKVEPVH